MTDAQEIMLAVSLWVFWSVAAIYWLGRREIRRQARETQQG